MSRPSRPPSPAPRVVNVPIPPPDAKSGFDWLIEAVFRPRPLTLLPVIAFALGAAHALTMVPLPVVLGSSGFWTFPRGIVPGSTNDMAQALTGYLSDGIRAG